MYLPSGGPAPGYRDRQLMPYVGSPVRRFEDPRLPRGQATFIEDRELPRGLFVAFVRSQPPHARLLSVDLESALATRAVIAAFDGRVLGTSRIPATVGHPALRPCGQPMLADGVVRYVGEPI